MFRFAFLRIGVLAVLMMVSGCSGGSGMLPPLPDQSAILSMIQNINERADSFLTTDEILFSERPGGSGRIETICDYTRCQHFWPVVTYTYTVETARQKGRLIAGIPGMPHDNIHRHGGIVLSTFVHGPFRGDAWETVYGLGGWMDYNYFTTRLHEFAHRDRPDLELGSRLVAYSIGDATGTNPVTGSAVWQGAMVGRATTAPERFGRPVIGNAMLTFDFADIDLDVAFTQVRDADGTRSHPDIRWEGLTVQQGRFGTGGNGHSIQGQFYGPHHEEVGGIFEGNQIIGAFGGVRQ